MAAVLDFDRFILAAEEEKRRMVLDFIRLRRESIAQRQDAQVHCEMCWGDVDVSFCYTIPACGHQFCIPVWPRGLTRSACRSTSRGRSRRRKAPSAAPPAGAPRRSRSTTSPRPR